MIVSGSRYQPPKASDFSLNAEDTGGTDNQGKGSFSGSSLTYQNVKEVRELSEKGKREALVSDNTLNGDGGVGNGQPVYRELPTYCPLELPSHKYKNANGSDKHGKINQKNIVVIHVCDENRQVTRDFNCRKDILMENMKYFNSYLTGAEHTLEEVDISVHCDVEIFEWLMQFIHAPEKLPKLDKTIVVSILISSEFLQMDSLVEMCLQFIASHLNEIIKLPIDLACISEKLLNRLALLIPPKVLATTKDKRDKILNKLYKRRVEIDFSRKAGSKNGIRSIASYLTCCQHCGFVYLEHFDDTLVCKDAEAYVDFRGNLRYRHMSIASWSLTGYLKSLHAGGMTWEAIYWHVWAACQIFQIKDYSISALETDKYQIEDDGIVISTRFSVRENELEEVINYNNGNDPIFNLSSPDDKCNIDHLNVKLLAVTEAIEDVSHNVNITETLIPGRSPGILLKSVFVLLNSQMKLIAGLAHKHLIEATGKSIAKAATNNVSNSFSYVDLLFTDGDSSAPDEKMARGRARSFSLGSTQQRAQSSDPGIISSGSIPKDGGSDTDGEAERMKEKPMRLRSQSTGAGLRRSKKSSSSQKKDMRNANLSDRTNFLVSTDIIYNHDGEINHLKTRKLKILKCLTPALSSAFRSRTGAVQGVWIQPSPLQLNPNKYWSSFFSIVDSPNLSENKQVEWKMDLMKEYDDKRFQIMESYSVSKRNESECLKFAGKEKSSGFTDSIRNSVGASSSGNKSGSGKDNVNKQMSKGDYYKDQGRKPYKVP